MAEMERLQQEKKMQDEKKYYIKRYIDGATLANDEWCTKLFYKKATPFKFSELPAEMEIEGEKFIRCETMPEMYRNENGRVVACISDQWKYAMKSKDSVVEK
jgi:hypothetical protein